MSTIKCSANDVPQMTREDFLRRIGKINVWKRGGQRAPHKPLLLLYALGRVLSRRKRFLAYDEIEPRLKDLLRNFGTPRRRLHPEAPFSHLCTNELWEVTGAQELRRTEGGTFWISDLRRTHARGGFPSSVYELLLTRPEVALEAANRLLQRHFPDSMHDEIRDAVGIPHTPQVREEPQPARDPAFRNDVLREYERRCAVCEFDVRLGDELIGLEAAHIKWHSHGGPDNVTNGLALCGLHHKALDRGALGLETDRSGIRILISGEVTGQSKPANWILDYHRQLLRLPRNRGLSPLPEFMHWHQRYVFRKPPLT